MTFETDKSRRLNRNLLLKISYYLGMVKFKATKCNDAEVYFRRLHPLTWAWIVFGSVYIVLVEGVPSAMDAINDLLKQSVWY